MKSFQLRNLCVPPILSSLPTCFPSLTHLNIILDLCIPPTISHLMSLKSLSDLRLSLENCIEPKSVLIALQPLADVLRWLSLHIESVNMTAESTDSADHDKRNFQMSYLLPFRSLEHLSIYLPSTSSIKRYFMELTGSFIRQHWKKLDRSIQVYGTTSDYVPMFREFLALSSSASTPSVASSIMSNSANGNCSGTTNHDNDSFGIKLWNASQEELNNFLEEMENASLLVPSSSQTSSPLPISPPRLPMISLQCAHRCHKREVETIESARLEMENRVNSHQYINLSSFSVHTHLLI
jgi:hypothetical protein